MANNTNQQRRSEFDRAGRPNEVRLPRRTETIRDTVKRDTLEIEEPSQLPVVLNAAKRQDDKKRDEKRAGEAEDKKDAVVPVHTDTKPGDQKRQPH
jgi:hypothetical protein